MSAKYFLDTNIFVYSFDDSQPDKKARALELISDGLQSGLGIISTQVVQEFLNVATRKFSIPLSTEDSMAYLTMVLMPLCDVYPDKALFEACLDLQKETGYSFYDCLIIASALIGKCQILYSEDLQAGQQIRGMKIINPLFS